MPEDEKQIGARLAHARELLLIPKTKFAMELGVSREKLYNYESGRTPVPWSIGHFVCNAFDVNPLWLATGKYNPFLDFGFGDDRPADAKTLFSEAVRTMPEELKRYCRSARLKTPRRNHRAGLGDEERFAHDMLEAWLSVLQHEQKQEFISELKAAGDRIHKTFRHGA